MMVISKKSMICFGRVKLRNAYTQYPTSLCLFISLRVNFDHMKVSWQLEISFWSKWQIWNPCPFDFHFVSIHVNASKELTEYWSEIFNWNEILLMSLFRLSCERTPSFFSRNYRSLSLTFKTFHILYKCYYSNFKQANVGYEVLR